MSKETLFRCIPQNRIINEYSPFGQHHTYIATHPIEAMLKPGYFVGEKDIFLPGDSLRIVQVEKPNIHSRDNRVRAIAVMLILAIGVEGPQLHPLSETLEFDGDGDIVS